jgi:hypothetical protein
MRTLGGFYVKEIDSDAKLRHGINFDPDLHFRTQEIQYYRAHDGQYLSIRPIHTRLGLHSAVILPVMNPNLVDT